MGDRSYGIHDKAYPEQEARLAAVAQHVGVDPETVLQKLVTDHLPPVPQEEEQDPTLALFAQWEEEDAKRTPEEIERENHLWEEFEKGINATRRAQGMRQL